MLQLLLMRMLSESREGDRRVKDFSDLGSEEHLEDGERDRYHREACVRESSTRVQ